MESEKVPPTSARPTSEKVVSQVLHKYFFWHFQEHLAIQKRLNRDSEVLYYPVTDWYTAK